MGTGCSVYDVPPTSGVSAGAGMAGRDAGFDGSNGGDGSGAQPIEPSKPKGSGGQALSVGDGAGQAGTGEEVDIGGDDPPAGSGGGLPGGWGAASQGGNGGGGATSGQGGNGGAGGASGSGGETAGAAGSTHCASPWRTQTECDQCATQQQSDLQACAVILECYVDKRCGPSSCASTDQKCGPNVTGIGAAAYYIAQTVYNCLCFD